MYHPRTTSLMRKPRRLTLTISDKAYMQLLNRSDNEGRSLSNLSAFLLEMALQDERQASDERHASPNAAWSPETRR